MSTATAPLPPAPCPPGALPAPAEEAWRFTNLPRAVAALHCTPLCTTIGCLEAALPVVSGPQMVFHNGHLSEALSGSASLAVGVSRATTAPGPAPTPRLDALDEIPPTHPVHHSLTVRGRVLLPLHLIHAASGQPSTSRFTITLEPGAELTLIEHQVAAPHFTTWQNIRVAIHVAAGARLTHSVQQTLPPTCLLTRRTLVTVETGGIYAATTLQQGGSLARVETHATLASAAQFSHVGLSLARRGQHHGAVLHVSHRGQGNTTHIRQRNLVEDNAHAAFQGKFLVERAAQHTNAYMHCHNLLLGEGARTSHKPELEIYADDVKCSHGAATGGLQAQQLFYLQARGLSPRQARALLTVGFAQEFIAQFPPVLHPSMEKGLADWLAGHVDTADPTPDFGMGAIRTTGEETPRTAADDDAVADE